MCGVVGIYGIHPDVSVAPLLYLALYALQHRGEESAGIAVTDGKGIRLHKEMGLVGEVFSDRKLEALPGHMGLGHVRYSTRGASNPVNAQPFVGYTSTGSLAVAHNGDLVNAVQLRRQLQGKGAVFQTTSDSEVILHLLAHHVNNGLEEAVTRAAAMLEGGFATVVMDREQVVGFRDPGGIRPLCWGKAKGFWAVASESAALASLGIDDWWEVPPGHLIVLDKTGPRLRAVQPAPRASVCSFEFIYFARPDSEMAGRSIHEVRKAIGRRLWAEHPLEADVVIPAPDSGISAAMGFSEASGIPFEMGLIKNRYVGRTFIRPTAASRELGVRIKLNPIRRVLASRRVVIIDDSIVRGTTGRKMIALIREAGAREVHMYVASPPIKYPCFYGIDIRSENELLAASRSIDEIRRFIGADTLCYLSPEGLAEAIGEAAGGLCMACMSGNYPTQVPRPETVGKYVLEGEPAR